MGTAEDSASEGEGDSHLLAGAELDGPPETAEDRSPGPSRDAQGLAVVFRELPLCDVVGNDSGESASASASLLVKTSPLEDIRVGSPRGALCLGVGSLEEKRSGGRSNAPGGCRVSAFGTAFEPAGRFSNSCVTITEMLLKKTDYRVRVEKLRLRALAVGHTQSRQPSARRLDLLTSSLDLLRG